MLQGVPHVYNSLLSAHATFQRFPNITRIMDTSSTGHFAYMPWSLHLRNRFIEFQYVLSRFTYYCNNSMLYCHLMITSSVLTRGFLAPGGIDHFGAPLLSLFISYSPLEVGPLEVGPLNPASRSEKRCKLPSGVWGEAPAANYFGAF